MAQRNCSSPLDAERTQKLDENGQEQFSSGKMLLERNGPVAIVTFNQPDKRNAISLSMWLGLAEIFDIVDADDDIRAVIIRGAGDKSFISGADVSEFASTRSSYREQQEHLRLVAKGRSAILNCTKPVIACIGGFCLGAGMFVATQADIRVAAVQSSFGVPAGRVGIAYPYEAVDLLVQTVGANQARHFLLTAEQIDAHEAYRIGFVSQIYPAADLVDQSIALAKRVASNAPISLAAAKAGIRAVLSDPGTRDYELLKSYEQRALDSDDYREGRTAFVEKRPPCFTGR